MIFIGCLVAGIFIKNYWAAAGAGVAWILAIEILVVVPIMRAEDLGYAGNYIGSIISGVLITSVVFGLAKLWRKNRGK